MHIQLACSENIPRIKILYQEAIAFQREAGHPFWKDPDFGVVAADIAAGNQYLLTINGHIAGIFSLCPPSALDEDLWRRRAPHDARYLNRIIVGAAWRGQRLLSPILAWCEREAACRGVGLLRLDTWADNPMLVAYYERFGFAYLGERTSSTGAHLAPQYRGVRLAIMEKSIGR